MAGWDFLEALRREAGQRGILPGMTQDMNDMEINLGGDVQVDDTKPEIMEEKLENGGIFRDADQQDMTNPNDEPGFADGVEGGWDGEDRQGDPNSLTGSDLEGEVRGGAGASAGGGIDGGPQR